MNRRIQAARGKAQCGNTAEVFTFAGMPRLRFMYVLLLIGLLSAILHARIFGTELVGPHAWRQTQTQLNILHFTHDDFNILRPQVSSLQEGDGTWRMEFPLFQWLAAGLHRMAGDSLVLTRGFVFLIGLLTLAGMARLAKEVTGQKNAAALAAWTFCFSPLFYYYTINPLPDNLALCFSTWGAAFFFAWMKNEKHGSLLFSVLLLALGALCKLPFVVYFSLFGGWLWNGWRNRTITAKNFFVTTGFVLGGLALAGSWYVWVIGQWKNNMVTSGMLGNQLDARALFDILFGNLVSTLPELLLNFGSVLFFLAGLYFFFRKKRLRHPFAPALLCWSAAVLFYYLFELNAISLIHDYYLMPFLPLLFLLVTYGVLQFQQGGALLKTVSILLLLLLPVTAFLRCDSRWDEKDPGFNADLVAYKKELRSAVPDAAKIIIGNDESAHIGFYYTGKRGWNFFNDQLSAERLRELTGKGAEYLYSDSRKVESDPSLAPFFGETVKQFGSIRIIRLKKGN